MKHTLKLFTALLLAPLAARADLVAHFRFEGDLKDVTTQHDGRPVDPKLAPSFVPGRVDNDGLVGLSVPVRVKVTGPGAPKTEKGARPAK